MKLSEIAKIKCLPRGHCKCWQIKCPLPYTGLISAWYHQDQNQRTQLSPLESYLLLILCGGPHSSSASTVNICIGGLTSVHYSEQGSFW